MRRLSPLPAGTPESFADDGGRVRPPAPAWRRRPSSPEALPRLLPDAGGDFVAALAPGRAGSWCRLALVPPRGCTAALVWAETAAGLPASPCAGFSAGGPDARPRPAVVFLPTDAARLRLRLFGPAVPPEAPHVLCTPVTRPSAAARVAFRHARGLLGAFARGVWRDPRGLPGRLRALVAALAEQDAAGSVHALWPALAGACAREERDALAGEGDPGNWPSLAVLVLAAGQNGPALAASLAAAAEALHDLTAIRVQAGGSSSPADTMADALFVMAGGGPAMKAAAPGWRDRPAHHHLSRCAGEVGSRSEPGEGIRHRAGHVARGIVRAMIQGDRAWPGGPCCPPLTRPAARGDLSRAAREVILGPSGGPAGSPVASLTEALARTAADYIAVLQAGEVIPPHALALLASQAARLGRPPLLSADEDRLDPDGTRCDPVRKPAAGRIVMLSGTLATGIWLIRRDLLAGLSSGARPWGPPWAETLRLEAWLRLHEAGETAAARHLPHVLSHRRADAETAPPEALAAVAAAHLARTDFPARVTVEPARPASAAARTLSLRAAAAPARRPRVCLIVPSACRDPHVRRCLGAVLSGTDYADFELVLVRAAPDPPTARQRRLIDALAADRRVRPVLLEAPAFNFAAACNRAAATSDAPMICLLNDDVRPRDPAWLAAMVGHLADPAVGVVGARLLYPDGSVQHAGVALRPDGGAVHAHRFLPGAAPGARLSREVAAVTGACLLTRRALWDRLGGLDEAYASAGNDIDYCLRAREEGQGVVLAAEAVLTHLESRSFGRHYAPGEASRATAERERLRRRFPAWFAADPFFPGLPVPGAGPLPPGPTARVPS